MNTAKSNLALLTVPANGHFAQTKCATVAAVVVTYNRLALLQECIAALRNQTRRPDEIIVVNNSSTDGTVDWLAAQADLTVVTQENSGSSGGQYTGTKLAYQRGHDWFWLMDDDTIPERHCLERLTRCPYADAIDTGCLSSLVLDVNGGVFGEFHFLPALPRTWALSVLQDRCVRVELAPFVSLLVHRRAVQAVGLPVAEFFLMIDDWEFTARIAAKFKSYCVLDSRVVHKAPNHNRPETAGSMKKLYLARNQALWVRLQPLKFRTKVRLLSTQFAQHMMNFLCGRVPVRILFWYFKGLTARVKIEPV